MAVLCDDQIRTTVGIDPPADGQQQMHANEGIAQVMFLRAQQICTTSYCGQAGQVSELNGTHASASGYMTQGMNRVQTHQKNRYARTERLVRDDHKTGTWTTDGQR